MHNVTILSTHSSLINMQFVYKRGVNFATNDDSNDFIIAVLHEPS